MRNAFAAEITALASEDNRIVFLSGDIGNRLFDDYKKIAPERFFNCGVAEANMMSMAAGLALCGMRPVVYSIAPFVTTRCIEQIKTDVSYHNLPVIIVGTGGGLSYAELGATHLSFEDIAFLRVLPNMTVICPADSCETRLSLRAAIALNTPVYIRLGKKNEPLVHKQIPAFEIGKGIIVRSGDAVCLIGTGNMLPIALQAAEEFEKNNISTQVVSLHTVKPLDEKLLSEIFSKFRIVATIEEHSLCGGLGSCVAEWLIQKMPVKARLVNIGLSDTYLYEAGRQEYARSRHGLTREAIVEKIMRIYRQKG